MLTTLRRRQAPPSECDDIVQVTILSLLRRRSKLEHLANAELHAYAMRAVVGTLMKVHRSVGRRRRLELSWMTECGPRPFSEGAPIAVLELHEVLTDLTPELRGVVVACDVHGLSHANAAVQLGLPLGTVKSRLRKAHGAVRELRGSRRRA